MSNRNDGPCFLPLIISLAYLLDMNKRTAATPAMTGDANHETTMGMTPVYIIRAGWVGDGSVTEWKGEALTNSS